MQQIKFGEVKISETAKNHVLDCLENNHVTAGKKVALLEQKWSDLFDYNYTVAVNSGTSACMTANMTLYDFGAVPGDEVIVPALSFIATANSIRASGFVPKFVDVKSDLLIDESKIEEQITDRTRAIMPVALMGKAPKLDKIREIARKHDLKVILDECESHGARYKGEFLLNYADVSVFSCYAAHILFSCEMGFVSTNNLKIAEAAESIRSHGRKPKSLYFDHERYGLNLKPTDLHASIGLGSIEEFWEIFYRRKYNWNYLRNNLAKYEESFWMSDEDEGSITSPHGFSLVAKKKGLIDGLKNAFNENKIDWKRNFGCMATQHACFSYLGHKLGDFPMAEWIGDYGIHVGVHYCLSDEDLERIVSTVEQFMENK